MLFLLLISLEIFSLNLCWNYFDFMCIFKIIESPQKNILGWNFICCGTLKCQLCFISKLSQSHGRYLCGIITCHNIAVAKCYFRRFVCSSLLPMISEFAWRMHVISPMHRFRWNQSVVVVGIWKFAIELVLGDGVGNVFPNYLILMWDTTSWCLSQTSKIQMRSGMSSACMVSWNG